MPPSTRRSLVASEHVLLLKGLLLLVVVCLAFVALWRYGLLSRVWVHDTIGISVGITVAFVVAQAHGSICLLRLARALNQLGAVRRALAGDDPGRRSRLPDGSVRRYLRDLHAKARLGDGRPVDLSFLLEGFETELKQGHLFSRFIADLLLSLGLLGTAIGVILMLGPISGGLDAIESALATMSGGMAVLLYTALTCLIGGLLLRLQGGLLDGAAEELIRGTRHLTELHILPTLEAVGDHAAV
jgi:hypothetical protein